MLRSVAEAPANHWTVGGAVALGVICVCVCLFVLLLVREGGDPTEKETPGTNKQKQHQQQNKAFLRSRDPIMRREKSRECS